MAMTAAAMRNGEGAQYKVVLLGAAAVGKSSLVQRFLKDVFVEFHEATVGAAFHTHDLQLEDESSIRLEIWDTAGQERYASLAPMYYRNAHAAIVTYDITNFESFEAAKRWVTKLHHSENTSVVIAICGNKNDLEDQRQVFENEARAYAEDNGALFIETSAKTAENVGDMFQMIAKRMPKKAKKTRANIVPVSGGDADAVAKDEAKSCCVLQ